MDWIINKTKGKSMKFRKSKEIIAETVYSIWTTCNMIIFQNHTKDFFQIGELKNRVDMCMGKYWASPQVLFCCVAA